MMNQPNMDGVLCKYRVTGKVQGVGFRHFLQTTAQAYEVRGWARNAADGSVIVLLCGDSERVEMMQEEMQQGPPEARVISMVELLPDDDESPPSNFDVL